MVKPDKLEKSHHRRETKGNSGGANFPIVGFQDFHLFKNHQNDGSFPGNYSKTARLVGAFLGGWVGITLAGIACGIEIGASPSFGFYLDVTVPVMGIWHAILGVIEGIITALVFGYVYAKAPSLIEGGGRA